MSTEERRDRLEPDSDLWLKLDATGGYQHALSAIKASIEAGGLDEKSLASAIDQVAEAEDALLCQDIRERHATPSRYGELLNEFRRLHRESGRSVPSVDEALRFFDDNFEARLIDVCVSHNEDASCLLETRAENRQEYRFPLLYPVGSTQADIRMVAATLRLADILDFDRERVPPVLYHYLLPRSATPDENISVREWQKHMTISNWEFTPTRVIFRGRSTNPIAHHAVVEFCRVIEEEIKRTQAALGTDGWVYNLGDQASAELHAEGFTYLPYRFSLQEEKIFGLLMGRGIYREGLAALRELLQNAVDSCQLKDALTKAYNPSVVPVVDGRITITYQNGTSDGRLAKLVVRDTGTGMDKWIIENYFLKVGESYYKSSDFLRTNAVLWRSENAFSPVSEFGIGFVSVFMLSDHIEVETAMLHSLRGDSTRRVLDIDGLGRLIRVAEFDNTGYDSMEGTTVTLQLRSLQDRNLSPSWDEIVAYLRKSCVDLPYSLHLVQIDSEGKPISQEMIRPRGLSVELQDDLNKVAFHFSVGNSEAPVQGEISLFGYDGMLAHQRSEVETHGGFAVRTTADSRQYSVAPESIISRGGFRIGAIPGLPTYIGFQTASTGILRLNAKKELGATLPATNISRSHLQEGYEGISEIVLRSWLEPLIAEPTRISAHGLGVLCVAKREKLGEARWLSQYTALDIYSAAREFWMRRLGEISLGKSGPELLQNWEHGDGPGLELGLFDDYLHRQLLDISLPHVSNLMVDERGILYVSPPTGDWKQVLACAKVLSPRSNSWSDFAMYKKSISNLLYYDYPSLHWFSDNYKKQLSEFSSTELATMRTCISSLINGKKHSYLPVLVPAEADIFQRLVALLPSAT
jgi:hypothetical protein